MAVLAWASIGSPAALAQWTQWGGAGRDFCTKGDGLADRWPDSGPRKVWSREIGGGHSAILVEGDTLYTACRRGDQDAVMALKADTGETIWETKYDSPTKPDMQLDFGPGPHSTPVLVGDRLFTVSTSVVLNCLDKKTGKILWTQDLMDKLGASHVGRGYGASPIAYKDTIIMNVGGRDTGVAAFKQDTGELAWKTEKLPAGHSSPILVDIGGDEHLVVALGRERIGLDPATGKVRWQAKANEQGGAVMTTPVFIAPDKLFFTAGYGGGSQLFKVSKDGDAYKAEAVWDQPKMRVHHQTAVPLGDLIVGSSGDFGPAFLMGVQVDGGKAVFRDRTLAKANVVRAGDKLLVLDETGKLALARCGPDKVELVSTVQLLEDKAWTVPTLVGNRLYLRDYKTIMALDLSKAANTQ